jgi:hypothetical protein
VIVELITRLVQEAPALDAEITEQLLGELRANGAPLALSIARVVELVADDLVDPGIALPALAMACGTLVDPQLTEREREAARFEIETLLPVPEKGVRFVVPDVPVDALKKRRD